MLRWIVQGDEDARRRLGALLRDPSPPPPGLDPGLLKGQGWPAPAPAPITIVLPVHGGHDLLDPVISRVAGNTDLPWHLVIIDDASPDPRIGPLLAAWRDRLGRDRVTLLTNPANLGFVGSANRGLAEAITEIFTEVVIAPGALPNRVHGRADAVAQLGPAGRPTHARGNQFVLRAGPFGAQEAFDQRGRVVQPHASVAARR